MKGNKKETDYKKALQQIALHFEYCDLTYDDSAMRVVRIATAALGWTIEYDQYNQIKFKYKLAQRVLRPAERNEDGSPCVETVPECACCGMSLPEGEDEPGAHRCNCLRSLMCRECNEMCQASRDGNLDCCEEAK